ncbi:MAG: helix-turn-helix domain-containing protein [Acidothermaceae bacterium]
MAGSFDLGEFIREQRRVAQISVRQLAKAAGVSNPYLSQIERGLRRPSAEILQQIAKGLRISAEAMYVQAGILDERIAGGLVVDAVLADTTINERQKQVMLEVYDSFRKENERRTADEQAVTRAAARLVPSADAFADVVDDIDDDGFDVDGAARLHQAEVDEPTILPPRPAPLRTTMTRHNPRRLP